MVTDSILQTIKAMLGGITEECETFDDQLLLFINTAFSILHQYGVGPEEGIDITKDTTWSEVINEARLNMVKTYVYIKVKLLFDPPSSSFVIAALQEQLKEIDWRIREEISCYGQ
jgi:hypothetical protein